jgi:hypothetical protein
VPGWSVVTDALAGHWEIVHGSPIAWSKTVCVTFGSVPIASLIGQPGSVQSKSVPHVKSTSISWCQAICVPLAGDIRWM